MKFIHTSDWHLGKQLYNYDRTDEFRDFFDSLVKIVKDNQPDALLICGDIYDSHTPTLGAQRLWENALLRLLAACDKMEVMVITGNHDSSSRMTLFRYLFPERLHIVGENPEIIRCGDAVMIMVPYTHEVNYRHLTPEAYKKSKSAIGDFYTWLVSVAKDKYAECDLPIVVMSHLALSRADYTGHTGRDFQFFDLESLPSGISYHALGHIHRPQTMIGSGGSVARYSGSPIPMNFDERYAHSISLVNIEKGRLPIISDIIIPSFRPVIILPEGPEEALDIDKVEEAALNFLKKTKGENTECYLRIKVKTEIGIPESVNIRMRQIFKDTSVRYCGLQPVFITSDGENTEISRNRGLSVEELKTMDPIEIAESHLKRQNKTLTDEMRALLKEIIEI